MPKFIYAGTHGGTGASDGNEADAIVAFGLKFPRGVAVDVADAHASRKLAGNAFFRPAPEEPVLPTVAPEISAALTPSTQPEIVAEIISQPEPLQAPRKGRRKA